MAKVSELNNDDLIKMIEKHEKILKKLHKESDKRGLGKDKEEMQEFSYDTPEHSESEYAFDLEKEGITQEDIIKDPLKKSGTINGGTASYRITQLLTLTPKQLEELNKESESKRTLKEKKEKELENNKNKPKGRFG